MHLERRLRHLSGSRYISLHHLANITRQQVTIYIPYQITKDLQSSNSAENSQLGVDAVLPGKATSSRSRP